MFPRDGTHISPKVTYLVSQYSQCYALLSRCRASKRSGNMKSNAGMLCQCGRAQYQHKSESKQGRMIGLQEAGLAYRACCYDSDACMDRRGSYAEAVEDCTT
jgi:hypothetical protein